MAFTECRADVSILSAMIFKWTFSLIYVKTCAFPLALNWILLVEFSRTHSSVLRTVFYSVLFLTDILLQRETESTSYEEM